MKAVRFHEYGGPDVLRYEDADDPNPAAGQVRIRVAATTFNPVEANIRAGFMRDPIPVTFPHTLGMDVSGTIDAVGADVTGVAVGDDVVGFLSMTEDGAAAEYVVTPADVLTLAPTSLPLVDAAALPSVGLTAWQALFEHGRLAAGQRVLITGAAGAVGAYAVQLAKSAGAYVIATASPRTADRVRTNGADEVVDHTVTAPVDSVSEPVDLVLNLAPIEPDQLAALVQIVRPGGAVVNTTVWMPAPSDESRDVRGVDVYVRSDAAQLAHLVDLVDRGELRIDVTERVPLAELPALHARVATTPVSGKAVVVVS